MTEDNQNLRPDQNGAPAPESPQPQQPQQPQPESPDFPGQPQQQPYQPARQAPQQPYQPPAPYGAPQQPPASGQPPLPGQPPIPGPPPSPYGQPAPYYQQPVTTSGKAVGALVCGIFAILLSWAPLFGIILGIVAIVLAGKAVKEAGKDGKATGGKVCGIAGIVLSVLAFILYIVVSLGVVAYIAANPESVVTDRSTPALNTDTYATDEDDQQAEAAFAAELDKLVGKDAALVQAMAAELDEGFSSETGFGLAELGVDPVEFAQWLLADFSYKLDGAYTYSDGTGTVYADVELRDAYAFASTFASDANEALGSSEFADETVAKAKLGELYRGAMEKTTDMTTSYISVDVVKKDGTWTVDQESWEEELDYLFGIY